MTVSSTASRVAYTGNGSTTAFAFTWRFLATTDIAVYVDGTLQSTGYSVSSPGSSGTVTFVTAPANGTSVVIRRATAQTQETDYVANDAFSADVTELAFDRAMLAAQDNAAAIGRTLRAPDYSAAVNALSEAELLRLQTIAAGGEVAVAAATEAQAEAGTDNGTYMTPLRTAQAIETGGVFNAALNGIRPSNGSIVSTLNALMVTISSAGGGAVVFSKGTYQIGGGKIVMQPNVELHLKRGAVLRRVAADVSSQPLIEASGISGFAITGPGTVDGNKASQTVGAQNIKITGCANFRVEGINTINAKAQGTNEGCGLVVIDSTDRAGITLSRLVGVVAESCEATGILITRAGNIQVDGGFAAGCVFGGLALADDTLPAPSSSEQQSRITITGFTATTCGIGMSIQGARSNVAALGQIWSISNYVNQRISIAGCTTNNNTTYGLLVQALDCSVVGHTASGNGSALYNAGICFNSGGVLAGCVANNNYSIGIDAGASYRAVISGCQAMDNGTGLSSSIGFNLGATLAVTVTGCRAGGNGNASGGVQFLASGWDGAGGITDWLPWQGSGLTLTDNVAEIRQSTHVGFKAVNQPRGLRMMGNHVEDYASGVPYNLVVSGSELMQSGNTTMNSSYSFEKTVASASSIVIPDCGDTFLISGTTTINTIKTYSDDANFQKVSFVNASVLFTGANGSETVSFSGGGGSGAAAIPVISANGNIYGAYVTNPGSGYTSAPTATISGGTATGGTFVVFVSPNNSYDRVITLQLASCTVASGAGNIYLTSNFTAGAFGGTLTLRGKYGNWYEVSRAVGA